MAIKTEPQVRKFGPFESTESEAMLGREEDARTFIPGDVDRPSVSGMVNQGSSIVPSEVNTGNLPPRVDKRG